MKGWMVLYFCFFLSVLCGVTWAGEGSHTAVFPLHAKSPAYSKEAAMISELFIAEISANPNTRLVDRDDLDKVLDEMALSYSGMVDQSDLVKAGHMAGADMLVTGQVFVIDRAYTVIARIIGAETGKVIVVKANGIIDKEGDLTQDLAKEVENVLTNRSDEILATHIQINDRISLLKSRLSGKTRPLISVDISEVDIGSSLRNNPAAETEIIYFLTETGFPVVDKKRKQSAEADLIIEGQGVSEFALQRGDLVSVKARLDVKVIDNKTGAIIATDRRTASAIDASQYLAAREALKAAAADAAEFLIERIDSRGVE